MKTWNLAQKLDRQVRSLPLSLRAELADPELWCLIAIGALILLFQP